MENEMQKVNIRGTDVYYYDNGCNVEEWLKQGHLYGESNYKILKDLIIADGAIVDAGAHIGTFSIPAALDGANVIMIEGAQKNVECLKETFGDTHEVHQAILADSVRKCSFSRDTGPFGWMVVDPDGAFTTSTIDSIVGDRKVAAIKLDIEGGEILALDGAKETLARDKPPILMEVNGYCLMQHGHRSEDLLRKAEEHGYAIFFMAGNQIVRVDTSKLFPFCNIDVICVHKDNLDKYSFADHPCMDEDQIEGVAKYICSRSNNDCKSYFRSIGIQ